MPRYFYILDYQATLLHESAAELEEPSHSKKEPLALVVLNIGRDDDDNDDYKTLISHKIPTITILSYARHTKGRSFWSIEKTPVSNL